jgi:hypothetical protein
MGMVALRQTAIGVANREGEGVKKIKFNTFCASKYC